MSLGGPVGSQEGGGLKGPAGNGASCGKSGRWCRRGRRFGGEEGGCPGQYRCVSGTQEGWRVRTPATLASLPQMTAAPTGLHGRPRGLGEAHGRGGRASKGRLWREVGPLPLSSRGQWSVAHRPMGERACEHRLGLFFSRCCEGLEGMKTRGRRGAEDPTGRGVAQKTVKVLEGLSCCPESP